MSREDPDVADSHAADPARGRRSASAVCRHTGRERPLRRRSDPRRPHAGRRGEARRQATSWSRQGASPIPAGIGLEEAGVELDARGYIRVNERLETTAPNVWAVGDCAGSPQFTHVSVDDFRIIRDNLAGGARSTGDRLVPYCVFTDPPLAHVGLSERDAQRMGIAVRVARLPMERGAAHRTQPARPHGFMKVLVGASDDRILGFTMIGSEAGEVMAAVQTAMLARLPYTTLRDAVIAHLTVAEGLGLLLANVPPR